MTHTGLDSQTQLVVKKRGKVSALSLYSVFDVSEKKLHKWNKVNGISVVGFNNTFVGVESYYAQRAEDSILMEIITSSNRRVKVSSDASCVVIDENRNFILHKKAEDVSCGDRLPLGKTVQIGYPFNSDAVGSALIHLLQSEDKSFEFKNCFVAEKVRFVFYSDWDDRNIVVGIKLKEGFPKYFQTSAGILMCAN